MYIRRIEDGSIMEYADQEFPGSTWAEGNIVRTMTGVFLDTDDIPDPPVEKVRAVKLEDIAQGYAAALAATLTMPESHPSEAETAAQAALFAAEDPQGLADVLDILQERRAELTAAANAAKTAADVSAISVEYPV